MKKLALLNDETLERAHEWLKRNEYPSIRADSIEKLLSELHEYFNDELDKQAFEFSKVLTKATSHD